MVAEVKAVLNGKDLNNGSSKGVLAIPKAVELAQKEEEDVITTTKVEPASGPATTQQNVTSSKKKKTAASKKEQTLTQQDSKGTANKENDKVSEKTVETSGKDETREASAGSASISAMKPKNNAIKSSISANGAVANVTKEVQTSSATNKNVPPSQQPQRVQQTQQRTLPFQPYAGIPPFNQLRETNLQDWPPDRGLTFIRPCPSGTSSLEKLSMLKNCPQILAYIQSFSGADWMEATFSPQPCIRLTATTQMPGGKATAEAILRLSDEMVLQWLHRFDPQMPIWAMFVCPAMLSGLMVGKQAVNLKKIEESSSARVWAAPRDSEAQYVSFFICSNNYEATRSAYALLEARAHNQMEMAMTSVQHPPPPPPPLSSVAPTALAKASGAGSRPVPGASAPSEGTEVALARLAIPSPPTDDDSSSTDMEPSTQQSSGDSTPPATHKSGRRVPPPSSPSGRARKPDGGAASPSGPDSKASDKGESASSDVLGEAANLQSSTFQTESQAKKDHEQDKPMKGKEGQS